MFHARMLAPCAAILGLALGCTSSTPTTEIDSSPTATVATAVNATCPIMGHAVKENGGRTEWNGQTVGFCCPKCIDSWEELSESKKATHLAASGRSDEHDQARTETGHAVS